MIWWILLKTVSSWWQYQNMWLFLVSDSWSFRRAHLKECFETLKKNVPNVDEKKTSNLSVLRSALRYIQVEFEYILPALLLHAGVVRQYFGHFSLLVFHDFVLIFFLVFSWWVQLWEQHRLWSSVIDRQCLLCWLLSRIVLDCLLWLWYGICQTPVNQPERISRWISLMFYESAQFRAPLIRNKSHLEVGMHIAASCILLPSILPFQACSKAKYSPFLQVEYYFY